jgi:hypothetical protein
MSAISSKSQYRARIMWRTLPSVGSNLSTSTTDIKPACCLRISRYQPANRCLRMHVAHVRAADSKSWHGQFRRRCLVKMGTDAGHRWGRPSPAGGPGFARLSVIVVRASSTEPRPMRSAPSTRRLGREKETQVRSGYSGANVLNHFTEQVAAGVDGVLAVVVRGWREVIVWSQCQERRRC